MKTLQTLTAAFLITFSMSAFAAGEPNNKRFIMTYAVETYIDAMTNGDIKELPALLDSDVKFSSTRANKVVTFNKSEIVQSLKDIENVKQNCVSSYKVLEQNQAQALIKVSMKYKDFTKVNYVTMENTSNGWKITNVSSSYN